MSTLVFTTKGYSRSWILSYTGQPSTLQNCSKLIDAIFHYKARPLRTDRVKFKGGKLFYSPSKEYREYVIRMKKIH